LEKLVELGIVRIWASPYQELLEFEGQVGEALSGLKVEAKEAKKAEKEAKMEALMWKFNLLMFVFAVLLGSAFMYFVVTVK